MKGFAEAQAPTFSGEEGTVAMRTKEVVGKGCVIKSQWQETQIYGNAQDIWEF